MWEIEKNFQVKLGGNTFINVPSLLEYDGQSIFSLKRHDDNGYLGVYFEIYDPSGSRIAYVKRNEIYPVTKNTEGRYKVDGSRTNCTFIDTQTRVTICDIKRYEAAHPVELDISVKLYMPDGFLLDATPAATNLSGNIWTGNIVSNQPSGFKITRGGHNVGM